MSKTLKTILVIVAAIVVLCAAVVVGGGIFASRIAGNAISMDATKISQVADGISPHVVPNGFTPVMSMDMMGVKMAMFGNDDQNGLITMMAMPAGASDADVERAMTQALDSQSGKQKVNWSKSETQPVTINGKEVQMKFSQGADSKGNAMRSITGAFTGENGTVGLFIMGTDATWNQAAIDAFLASLK